MERIDQQRHYCGKFGAMQYIVIERLEGEQGIDCGQPSLHTLRWECSELTGELALDLLAQQGARCFELVPHDIIEPGPHPSSPGAGGHRRV